MSDRSFEEILADFVYGLSYKDFSSEVVEKTKISIADGIACAIAGIALPSSKIALDVLGEMEKEGRSTIWTNGRKVDLESAAWINCLHMHGILHDDMQASTVGHMGSIIIPTTLACAEQEGCGGKELLTAVVAAYETAGRIAVRSGQAIVNRGFRGSPIFGTFAAAVAAGKLMGLTVDQLRSAIGLAGNFSCGLLESPNRGSMEWRFQNGTSLRNGILAARLAKRGLEAADSVLEGTCGFFASFGGKDLRDEIISSKEEIFRTLGEEYEVSKNIFKPYATCGYNQIGVSIITAMARRDDLSPEEIREVVVYVSPENKRYPGGDFHGPFSTIDQALLSKPFSVASALKDRNLTVDTYLSHLKDPDLLEIAEKVRIEETGGMGFLETRIEIHTKDGRKITGDNGLVDMNNYLLSREYAIAKFNRLTRDIFGDRASEDLVRMIFDFHKMDRVADFTGALTSALGGHL